MKKVHGFPLEQVFRDAYLAKLGASFAEFQKDPQGTLEKLGQHAKPSRSCASVTFR